MLSRVEHEKSFITSGPVLIQMIRVEKSTGKKKGIYIYLPLSLSSEELSVCCVAR